MMDHLTFFSSGLVPQLIGELLTLWIFRGLTFCVNRAVSAEVS